MVIRVKRKWLPLVFGMKRLKLLPVLIFSLCLANPQAMADNNDDNSNRHHHRHNYTNGIRNLRTVHPWLLRGGAPPDQSFKTLSDMGVTTVVDLRDRTRDAAKEKELCKNFGMNFVQIPLSHRTAPTKEQINKFLKIVDTARQHTGKGSVFVHCELGDDRTGCMVAISRIAFDNYTFHEAYEEMLHFGFSRHFYVLTNAVKEFAEQNKDKVISK